MRYRLLFLAALVGVASDAAASSPILLTVNDFGDAGPGNCVATCTLRDALHDIADGGIIEFAPAPVPQTITLAHGPLLIMKSVTILGPGPRQLAISASKLSRVLEILAHGPPQGGQQIVVAGVTLRDGKYVGSNGGDGINGASDLTVNGQPGQQANGGCLFANLTGPYEEPTSVFLEQLDVRECEAIAGNGGTGGSGGAGSGGISTGKKGGNGGSGGSAAGGAINILMLPGSSLDLTGLSVFNASATGGDAGPGGDGGPGFFKGEGGAGGLGGSGSGGAIYVATGIAATLYNSTIADSGAMGGNGADGGDGDASLNTVPGGNGGNGGSASGGLVVMPSGASIAFTTLSHGGLTTGAPGNGGSGAVGGAPGQPGTASGVAISSSQATAVATVIVGPLSASASLCSAGVAAKPGYVNLDEDSGCSGFTLHGSLAELFRPLDLSGTAWPAYMPRYGSKIIDAATCSDGTAQPPTNDQHGTTRPQGPQCDLGAIEADYIFVGVFD
jgi:hypothetical protein